ncbi:hypothetical protein [Catalinimonas niigatensis]|uniref:hypothetical protein n=1 Tax=Catalinimonas niigatensis TaxID=1397264 RepID=UPI0026667D5D|nr:hypothetical protein [Catalinimonas niigatensis]WPP52768.1 hypothetical protein PZB72_10305 [Catalinimonas niigatensis]
MIFSSEFKIKRTKEDDWFDPILSMDTKLFIDPFLVFESDHGFFINTHQKTIDFFNLAFKIASVAKPNETDIRYRQLLNMMRFPEVEEVCLGYASRGTGGSGSGGGFSKMIVDSIFESIKMGITNLNHFEEIGLFNEGFGCDRISDMTATLLKKEIVLYTQDVCKRHKISTGKVNLSQFEFDNRFNRWKDREVELPLNPYTKKAILLVPKKFLRELPTISAEEFYEFCWSNKNEELRDQYSIEVKSQVNKSDIIEIARQNREWIAEYEAYRNQKGSKAYDIAKDPKGYYNWVIETLEYVKSNSFTFTVPSNQNGFNKFTKEVIKQFEQFIENNSGYKLLWDDKGKRPKSEEASQLLFTGIVKHYCKANNIDLNREINLGRGPVDFKFSSGYEHRALIEVKLAKNSKFWNGLEKQIVKYLEVEEIKKGHFIVICYNDNDIKKVTNIEKIASEVGKKNKVILNVIVIDASFDKPSASKL